MLHKKSEFAGDYLKNLQICLLKQLLCTFYDENADYLNELPKEPIHDSSFHITRRCNIAA